MVRFKVCGSGFAPYMSRALLASEGIEPIAAYQKFLVLRLSPDLCAFTFSATAQSQTLYNLVERGNNRVTGLVFQAVLGIHKPVVTALAHQLVARDLSVLQDVILHLLQLLLI